MWPHFLHGQELTIDNLTIQKSGQISWTTTNELEKTIFIIQEFRWNKWMTISEVNGKGFGNNSYSYLADTTCGIYQVRICSGKYCSSNAVYPDPMSIELISATREVSVLKFNAKTKFEVYNAKGKKILFGCDAKIDITKLIKGTYYLNYGNKTIELVRF